MLRPKSFSLGPSKTPFSSRHRTPNEGRKLKPMQQPKILFVSVFNSSVVVLPKKKGKDTGYKEWQHCRTFIEMLIQRGENGCPSYLVTACKLTPVNTAEAPFPQFIVIVEVVSSGVQLPQRKDAPRPKFLALRRSATKHTHTHILLTHMKKRFTLLNIIAIANAIEL